MAEQTEQFGSVSPQLPKSEPEITEEEVNSALQQIEGKEAIEVARMLAKTTKKAQLLEQEKKGLYEIVGRDHLTGLLDRTGFFKKFQDEMKTLTREEEQLQEGVKGVESPILYKGFSLLFVDLVGLKEYNDTFSYKEGDELLKRASQRLQQGRRETDIVARWGGDEFLVGLLNTDIEGAMRVVSEIQEDLPQGVKFYIGIGEFGRGDNILEAVDEASEAMVNAKRIGLKDEKGRTLEVGVFTIDRSQGEQNG